MAERLPILDELGDALEAAFVAAESRSAGAQDRRTSHGGRGLRPVRRRTPWRTAVLVAVLLLALAATAAAATLVLLRETVIRPPDPRDAGPAQTPAPGTSRLSPAVALDPDGRTRWAVRLSRTRSGLVCGTVGELQDQRFGLTGLDGRFRLLPERLVDGCSVPAGRGATLIGARVFDGRTPGDVRTVVYGLASGLRRVDVETRSRSRGLRVARDGTFLAAYAGYPEDLAIRVSLTYTGGRTERHPFGVSRFVVPDPEGGRAWRVEAGSVGVAPGERPNPIVCATFRPAREVPMPAISPAACGAWPDPRRRRGVFFAVRRITPGTGGVPVEPLGDGNWGDHPARTAVWGQAGEDVERIVVTGPGGLRQEAVIAPSRSFLAIFGGEVDPQTLTVHIRYADGRVERRRGDTNLTDGPLPGGRR